VELFRGDVLQVSRVQWEPAWTYQRRVGRRCLSRKWQVIVGLVSAVRSALDYPGRIRGKVPKLVWIIRRWAGKETKKISPPCLPWVSRVFCFVEMNKGKRERKVKHLWLRTRRHLDDVLRRETTIRKGSKGFPPVECAHEQSIRATECW